jgi:hypothetical protein
MTRIELEEALGDNNIISTSIKATELSSIMEYVKVDLQLDKRSLDYFYEIDVNELLSSKMPSNDLEDLKEEGWSLNKEKTKLILFLNY